MKLRLQTYSDELKFAYSTDPRVTIADYGASTDASQWAIFVPFANGSPDGEWFLTTASLSLSRAGELVSKATLVWRCKLLDETLSTIESNVRVGI